MSFAHLADVRLNRGPRFAFDQRHLSVSFLEGIPMKRTLLILASLAGFASTAIAEPPYLPGEVLPEVMPQPRSDDRFSRYFHFVMQCGNFSINVNRAKGVTYLGPAKEPLRPRTNVTAHFIIIQDEATGYELRINRDSRTYSASRANGIVEVGTCEGV
jgi:hypothetical protein